MLLNEGDDDGDDDDDDDDDDEMMMVKVAMTKNCERNALPYERQKKTKSGLGGTWKHEYTAR